MDKTPEVSIIINCLNEAEYVAETLDSVFAQTFQDWEVIFWDNASSDGSGDIAASYGDKVRCFRSENTLPLGKARKAAYEQTRGKFIAILDADDLFMPQKLERQLELFQAEPEIGMTYCDSISFDGGGDRYRLFKLTTPQRGRVFGELLSKNFMFSSSMMFRREALEHDSGDAQTGLRPRIYWRDAGRLSDCCRRPGGAAFGGATAGHRPSHAPRPRYHHPR